MMSDMRESLPRCETMDGTSLRIVPAYTEAGYFQEANAVTITDGERTAVYVPATVQPKPPNPDAVVKEISDGLEDRVYWSLDQYREFYERDVVGTLLPLVEAVKPDPTIEIGDIVALRVKAALLENIARKARRELMNAGFWGLVEEIDAALADHLYAEPKSGNWVPSPTCHKCDNPTADGMCHGCNIASQVALDRLHTEPEGNTK